MSLKTTKKTYKTVIYSHILHTESFQNTTNMGKCLWQNRHYFHKNIFSSVILYYYLFKYATTFLILTAIGCLIFHFLIGQAQNDIGRGKQLVMPTIWHKFSHFCFANLVQCISLVSLINHCFTCGNWQIHEEKLGEKLLGLTHFPLSMTTWIVNPFTTCLIRKWKPSQILFTSNNNNLLIIWRNLK